MKRRFVQMREPPYDFVEVTNEYEPPRRDDLLYGDRGYDGLRASDGANISTRTKHREYMKRNGLTTMDDFAGQWAKERKARDDYFTGKRGSVNRQDIARAIEHLQTKDSRKH
jgi:hypothetical protein